MEVNDRALKEPEREDAVRAAAKATLDAANDSAILSRSRLVDELGIPLHRLLEIWCAAPTVREPVGDQLRPIQSDGLENDHIRMMGQHRDQDVREQMIDVCQQSVHATFLRRCLGQLGDPPERIGHAAVPTEELYEV